MKSELLKLINYIEVLNANKADFYAKYNECNSAITVYVDGARVSSFVCPDPFDLIAKVTTLAAANKAAWSYSKDGYTMEAV